MQQLIVLDARILLLVAAAIIPLMVTGKLISYIVKRSQIGMDKDEFSVLLNLGTPKVPKSISYVRSVTKEQEPKDVIKGLNNLPTNARIVDENGKEVLTFNSYKHDG